MRIKAITLWNPWALLMAAGAKTIETRSWATGYKGPLAIHAAKKKDTDILNYWTQPAYRDVLEAAGFGEPDDQFFGCIVAVVNLQGCWPSEKLRARLEETGRQEEILFGNYAPGRYGWVTNELRKLKRQIPAKGAQGLWYWTVPHNLVRPLGLQEAS
jgi:hypothetical protein